ncbi:MAG: helix-turn-helix domain-containing protein [Halobacteriaceae archaeon]
MAGASERTVPGLRPADETILAALAASRAEYPAILAAETGLHVPYVRRRCDALAESGLVEQVSDEVVYRLTDAGERALSPRDPRG